MADPHLNGSFSYKTINEDVKKILDSRSDLSNRTQVAQPFIKVTSTLRLPEILGEGNVGFTLGLHAIPEDVAAEDIYSDKDGNALIGYTYTPDGKNKKIYANVNSDLAKYNKILDNSELFSTTTFSQIPPVGITSLTVGRNKSGLTSYAQISFSVPTQAQLELLHRTILIPGIGVIVEWGQQFAETDTSFYGQSGINSSTISEHMFPWYKRSNSVEQDKLLPLITRLGNNQVGLEEIFKNYVIPTQGQYMWIFGRVANFSVKSNGDGSFEGTMKVIGPSENAWAYTVRNTVVPPRLSNGSVCSDSAQSIESFFTNTSNGVNLNTLLQSVYSDNPPSNLSVWKSQVTKFTKPNKDNGEETSEPNASESSFADSEDSYFMTWRFFVNVVLNSEEYGLKKIFAGAQFDEEELKKFSLIRPYTEDGVNLNIVRPYINDPYENFVGNNKYLRSIDPGTMIIVNEKAVQLAAQDLSLNRPGLVNELTKETELSGKFATQGDYYWSAANVAGATQAENDKGLLSTGVWVNHKAVVQSMVSADTVMAGVSNLLQRMSAATMNFWQLSLDVSEPLEEPYYTAPLSYTIVDVNYRENSNLAVDKFKDKVHVFNKYIRSVDGRIVGSDVLECNVDLNLPKRLFSQIATLGLVQANDIDANNSESPILSDPNETLRKIFAITSLSTKDPSGLGPDLSAPTRQRNANDSCGGNNSQTPAQTGGSGNQTAPANFIDVTATTEDTDKQIKSLEQQIQTNCTGSCLDVINAITTTTDNLAVISNTEIKYQGVNNIEQVVTIDKESRGNSQNTRALFSRGYRNGRIPRNKLQQINQGNHRLYKDAAQSFIQMASDAQKVGISLNVSDSYRPIEQQIALIPRKGAYSKAAPFGTPPDTARFPNGLGATPGTSNHGWGLAVDLNRGSDFNQTLVWLQTNASTYGFNTISGEPWHWEYTRPIPESTIDSILSDPLPPPPVTPNVTPTAQSNTNPECSECVRQKILLNQLRLQQQNNSNYDRGKERLVKEFPNLEQVFRYVEAYGDLMVANIARSSDGSTSNAFGAAPGALSIDAELVLPGVNGLRVGELFWIDRIPTYYKVFGAFQILGLEDIINADGWKTRINSKFNYLGDKWKQAMVKLLS
jgi:LAS superfamily LD-carboxypeptidase LdcB